MPYAYMQKAGDTCDISPQFFLDFPQNFRLRTRNVHDLRTFSTILDGATSRDGLGAVLISRSQPKILRKIKKKLR